MRDSNADISFTEGVDEYWNGTGWGVGEAWQDDTVDSFPTWTFGAPSTPTWSNGTYYRVKVRSVDNARNVSAISQKDFYYDTTKPTVLVREPASDGSRNSLATISGSAGDTSPGQVWRTQLRVKFIDGDKYRDPDAAPAAGWKTLGEHTDGGGWYVAYSTVSDKTVWYSTNIAWYEGYQHEIVARSWDKTYANYSDIWSTRTITYDTVEPNSVISVPGDGTILSASKQNKRDSARQRDERACG